MPIIHAKNDYVIPRGRVYFDPEDASEAHTGEIDLGNCPGVNIAIESEKAEHYSSTTGMQEKDGSWPIRIDRSGELTCDNFSPANAALWLAGTHEKRTQQAIAVSGEQRRVLPGRHYQLGATTANPLGVRNVTGITMSALGVPGAPVLDEQQANVDPGDAIVLASPPASVQVVKIGASLATAAILDPAGNYAATATGILIDAAAPDVPAGSTLWVSYTAAPTPGAAYVAGVDYNVDSATGRVQIVEGGAIAAATEVVFGYTPVAATFDRVASGSKAELRGALRIVSDNAAGSNRDWYMPRVSLTANGDLPLIADGTDVVAMTFELDVLKPANAEAIYCDGLPVAMP